LHDIGHGPFSHTLESILRDSLKIDHVDLTEKLILGEHAIFDSDEKEVIDTPCVFDILDKNEIDKKSLIEIIRGNTPEKNYLGKILNSAIDTDQLDYITRDAYYTGVAYGMVDIERFLQTLFLKDEDLTVKRKGVGVVENILMARILMYSSVYFHKTVRIAELMLSKAIELLDNADPFDFFKMTDAEIITDLKQRDGFQYEIATRLKYRRLFKQAYAASQSNLDKTKLDLIKKFDDISFKRNKELEFEEALNIPSGHVIIDVPYKELHSSEPRIDQTDIIILDGEETKQFDQYSPVGDAVRTKEIPDWIIMIVCDDKYRDVVADKAERILFN
jgi:HD superfamily phosphohydrolase